MNRLFATLTFMMLLWNANAANIYWVNGASGNWDDPTKWVGNVIPGVGDVVTISDGTVLIPGNYTAVCDKLVVQTDQVDITIEENGGIEFTGSALIGGYAIIITGGTIKNNGLVEIFNVSYAGIFITQGGRFTNTDVGTLTISNVSGNGVFLDDGDFIDSGSVSMNTNISSSGIRIRKGSWYEEGVLFISDVNLDAILLSPTLSNMASFTVGITGEVTVIDTNDAGIKLSTTSATQSATLSNSGQITISDGQSAFSYGIVATGTGATEITNEPGGTMTFDNMRYGIYIINNAVVENEPGANITITNCLFGMTVSNSVFNNSSSITLEANTSTGLQLLGGSTFNNNAPGEILLKDNARNLDVSSVFNNYAELEATGAIGTPFISGTTITGVFTNFPTGVLNCSLDATSGSISTMELQGSGKVINQGDMTLSGTITNVLQIPASAVFTNYNQLDLQNANATGTALNVLGEFVNEECGKLTVDRKMNFATGAIVDNKGGIYANTTDMHTAGITLTNSGVIADNNNTFSNIIITNDGYSFTKVSGVVEPSVPIFNVFSGLGTDLTLTNNEWYTTADLSVSAGTYNPANNSFTPSANAAGLATLYMELNDVVNSCADVFAIEFDAPILPIELLDFVARTSNDKDVELQWWSLTEENMSHFNIQHSVDGKNWVSTAKVRAAGNSIDIQNYAFTDVDAFAKYPDVNSLLYRLEMVEFGGVTEYSPVRIVETNREVATLTLFPNPVSNDFHIVPPSRDFETLQVFDIYGHLLKSLLLVEGKNSFSAEAMALPQGVYTLMSTNKAGQRIEQRMIVAF